MKTINFVLPLLVLALSSGSVVACGDDGGGDGGSGGINLGGSGGSVNPGGSGGTGNPGGSGGTMNEGGSGGTGPCVNTGSTCDECLMFDEISGPTTDFYHVCADSTANCIPFDNTRVPGWPNSIPTP